MKKLKLFFACLLMAVLSIGQVWAGDVTSTMDLDGQSTSPTTSTTSYTATQSASWTLSYVAETSSVSSDSGDKYYQIGSSKKSATSMTWTSSSYSGQKVKQVQIKGSSSSTANVTVVSGSTTFTATTSTYSSSTAATLTFNSPTSGGDVLSSDLVITISFASAQTKNIRLFQIDVIYDGGGDPDPQLTSITVEGDLDTKEYEEGGSLDFAGLTATGHYDNSNTVDLTSSVEWSFTPALTVGLTSVTVTATLGSISGDKDIDGLTVSAHTITPGEYEVLLSNTLWGVTSGQQAAGVTSMSGETNDISFTTTKGSSQIFTDGTQTRFYGNGTNNATLTIAVPSGYAITSIVFAEPSSNKTWNGSISVDNGEYTAGTKTWEGEENSVTFTFGAQNRAATATVTYKVATADAPSVIIDPTSINATEAAASGTIDATYTNITLASVTIGRFNDEACTEDFTGDWLTASLNSDKDIEYTIAANTGEARTAYIKLTAPASNGTSPDVVKVIEVAQARAIPTYTSLSALFDDAVAADAIVKIVFDNCIISGKKDDNTAYLTDKDNTYGLVIYTTGHGFNVGDVLNGTVQTTLCKYNGNSELKGLAATSDGLIVTTGGTITPRVVADPTALTGANAGSVITINGSCTVASSKYYVNGVQLYNTLYDFENPTEGNQYNCTGVFLMFNTTKEILPRSAADIEEVAIPTAVINLDDVVIEEGKSTTLSATVTPAVAASADVTYSIIDGGEYISLSGASLTATAKGTAHILATVADDLPNYYGVTKEIEVTVTEVDSRYKAEQTGFTEISGALTTVTEGTHKDKNYITYEAKKGASSTVPAIQDEDKIRIYQNGGLLVIGAVKGCKIDQVFLTTGGAYNSTTIGYSTSELSIATTGDNVAKNAVWSTSTGLNTDSVVIVCLGTSKTTRLDVAKIDVRYTGDPIYLESIAISGTATALEYTDGQHFDPAGLSVIGTYSDASTEPITEGIDWTFDPDPLTEGTTSVSVTATAGGFTSAAFVVDGLTVSGAAPLSPWATVYTSNVEIESNTAAHVTIGDETFDAVKTSKGSSATITLPYGVTAIHLHLVAWSGEDQTVSVTGDCFNEAKEITIEANAGVSGQGTTYDLGASGTDYYFSLTPDNAVAANTVITITAEGSKRFVLFGVNQVGGVLPELQSIEIDGDLTKKEYEAGEAIDVTGLTVVANYTLAGVPQPAVDITNNSDLEWTYAPLVKDQTSVTLTATFEGKNAQKTIEGLTVTEATPAITASPSFANFGSVNKDAVVDAKVINVTLTNVASATVALSGTGADGFTVDKTALTASGTISITPVTTTVGSYSAKVTISDDAGVATAATVTIMMNVMPVDEGDALLAGVWTLVTDASQLVDGSKVIIAQYVNADGAIRTMSTANNNNRASVESTVAGTALIPADGTRVMTLEALAGGKFAFRTNINTYLYAASSSSNYLRDQLELNDNGKWTITIDGENKAVITAQGTNSHNIMRYNASDALFSCYTGGQKDVQLFIRTADFSRTDMFSPGVIGTLCVDHNVPLAGIDGATFYELAGLVNTGFIAFDEIVAGQLNAGVPYLFQANSNELKLYFGTTVVTSPVYTGNGLHGTFVDLHLPADISLPNLDDIYYFANRNFWNCDNLTTLYIPANRAYLNMSEVPDAAPNPNPGRRRITMGVNASSSTTGCENIESGNAPRKQLINGTIYIIRGEKVYDTTGRLVK